MLRKLGKMMRGGSREAAASGSRAEASYEAMPSAPEFPTAPTTASVVEEYSVQVAAIVSESDASDGKEGAVDFSAPTKGAPAATIVANEEPNQGSGGGAVQESIGTIFADRISSSEITSSPITSSSGISAAPISSTPISSERISSSPLTSTPITTPYTQFAVADGDTGHDSIGLDLDERGGILVVSRLAPGGAAACSDQIIVGDIVRTIDGDKVRTVQDASEKLRGGKAGDCVVLVLERMGGDGKPTFQEVALRR